MVQMSPDSPMEKPDQKELMRQAFLYEEALLAYAYGLLQDWALAEDSVQEAFLLLLEKQEEYRPEFGVYGWLKRMVYFKVQEARRKRAREFAVQDDELQLLVQRAVDDCFDEEAARCQARRFQALQECISVLTEASVQILIRFYWRNQSGEQIAQSLNRSLNSVWLALSRIRKQLRDCISHRLPQQGTL